MKKNSSERGSAMMLVVIIVLVLVGISGAYLSISWWNTKRSYQDEAAAQALYIAESGAAQYINWMNAATVGVPPAVTKRYLSGGYYWVPVENIVDFSNAAAVGANNFDPDYASFQVAGKYNGVTRRINVLVTHKAGGVFWNAIYAGNKGVDPNYSLNLTGDRTNNTQDIVKGNVYTGNHLAVGGDAQLFDQAGTAPGKATFKGTNNSTVTGPNFVEGTEPDLVISRTNGPTSDKLEAEYKSALYNGGREPNTGTPGTAWVDVAGQFTANGASHRWTDGSTATDILDVNNPAHIFRKNPSSTSGASRNRTGTYEYSVPTTSVINTATGRSRNDYYLEDPTNSNVTQASLTGVPVNGDTQSSMLNVNAGGNNAVYYIDGNLRVSGEPIKSYQFNPAAGTGDIKMTFIVKGNVSLTDNLLYPNWESTRDAVAIIAVTDPAFPNTKPSDFAIGSGSTLLTPNGVSIDTFVTQYNNRAQQARRDNLNMPDIDLSTVQGQARASQEYNKIYGSGNVFFGDPGSGTVEHFEAFMYAENNFYATNLDTTQASGGTRKMEIFGNMTAGNQVSIDRTVRSGGGYAGYIPLHVTFDPIIMGGNRPPGLPPDATVSGLDWRVVSWKQSTMTAETGGDK